MRCSVARVIPRPATANWANTATTNLCHELLRHVRTYQDWLQKRPTQWTTTTIPIQIIFEKTSYVRVYIHIYTYICVYIYVYVCIYVCMYVYMYVCKYLRMNVFIYVCLYMCMYLCLWACMRWRTYLCLYYNVYVCTFVCTYCCIYLCVYVFVCIYVRMSSLFYVVHIYVLFTQSIFIMKSLDILYVCLFSNFCPSLTLLVSTESLNNSSKYFGTTAL